MSTLFWIGAVIFALSAVARLYVSYKIKAFKDDAITMGEFNQRTAPYRHALYLFTVSSLIGITLAIFGV